MNLDPDLRAELDRCAATDRLLVASDFDGVLAPIVDNPAAVAAIPASMAALRDLGAEPQTEVAIVSGRPLDFLRTLDGAPAGAWLAGSHGSELGHRAPTELTAPKAALLERVTADLQYLAERTEGATVETKAGSVAFHYRKVDPAVVAPVRTAILDGPGALPGVEVKHGKMVIELAVFSATKGTAIRALRAETAADSVIYLGDDITDEDAFAALGPDDLGIKVGEGDTIANRRIDSPDEAAAVLRYLADARRRTRS
jgi:trehalose 6-phosphate phosphatase